MTVSVDTVSTAHAVDAVDAVDAVYAASSYRRNPVFDGSGTVDG